MTKEELANIRAWLIKNIFRDGYVMFSPSRDIDGLDLIYVIASLYEELHKEVEKEPYEYMFHWANKCGSWVDDDLFENIKKGEANE